MNFLLTYTIDGMEVTVITLIETIELPMTYIYTPKYCVKQCTPHFTRVLYILEEPIYCIIQLIQDNYMHNLSGMICIIMYYVMEIEQRLFNR